MQQPQRLPLVEHMYTVQGEGTFQGHAAYFIRLAGCDVGCVWCDTKHSWQSARYPQADIEEIVGHAAHSGSPIAVITGGEPTLHNLKALTARLKVAGMRTHLETAGVHPLTGQWDWICLSPKKFKSPLPAIYPRANELKVVICHASDLQWAEQQAAYVGQDCALLLQPEWSRASEVTPLIRTFIQQKTRWKISLQLHKHMHIP